MAQVVPVPTGLLPTPDEYHHTSDAFRRASHHLVQQAEVRATQVQPLILYLTGQLARAFHGITFRVQLYGSLHHGLYLSNTSKINIDVSVADGGPEPANVLHILASLLQGDQCSCPWLAYPVLVWHRTVHRPLILMLFWNGILVHLTHNNIVGLRVSDLMWRTLSPDPYMRLTLLHWKFHFRQSTQVLGPNHGQVSTYALFTTLLQYAAELPVPASLEAYEMCARRIVTIHLGLLPRLARTRDTLSPDANLTAHSFLAPDAARHLLQLPVLV